EGSPPDIRFDRDFKALGRRPSLNLTVADVGTGLKGVVIRLKQKDRDIVLVDESFPRSAEKSRSYDIGKLIADKAAAQTGSATLSVEASDHALRNFFQGNHSQVAKSFEFQTDPPRLEVLSGQHYINQGGSECVVYRVSE